MSSMIRLKPFSMSFEPTIASPSVASASPRSDVLRSNRRAFSSLDESVGLAPRPIPTPAVGTIGSSNTTSPRGSIG